MYTLNTMQDYDRVTSMRAHELLTSGDEALIKQYMEYVKESSQFIIETFPNISEVTRDFDKWLLMSKAVIVQSEKFLKLVYSEKELQKIMSMVEDVECMREYWETVCAEFQDQTVTDEEMLSPFQFIIDNH